jgi:hypothetical protein
MTWLIFGYLVGSKFKQNGFSPQKLQIPIHYIPKPVIKPFKKFVMLGHQNKLLIATDEKFYRYNLDPILLEDSFSFSEHGINFLNFTLAVTPNEKKAYVNTKGGEFMGFDPLNFNDIRQYNFEPLTKTFTDPSEWLNLLAFGNASNNGLVTIAIWRGQYYTMVLYIINNQVVWHSPPGNAFAPVISQNGQHLAADIFGPRNNYEGWILKRENGHFNFLGKIDPGDHSFTEGGSEVLSYTRIRDYSDTYNGGYVGTFNLLDPPMDFTSSFTKISEVTLPAVLVLSQKQDGVPFPLYG